MYGGSYISQKAVGTLSEYSNVMPKHVGATIPS
jgi:hypothetical protein